MATDGAVWVGLTRFTGHEAQADADAGTQRLSAWCARWPGPEGGVWVEATDQDELALYQPDGTLVSLPPAPEFPGDDPDAGGICPKTAGIDGSAWVTTWVDVDDEECNDASTLVRWDGRRWNAGSPFADVGVREMVSTDDGATWGFFYEGFRDAPGQPGLWRYANGRWKMVIGGSEFIEYTATLVAAPGGRVCTLEDESPASAITCYGSRGERVSFDITGMEVVQFSVAPDGAIWVIGSQVARLDQTLPRS